MALSVLYLAVNILALLGLLRAKYYRQWKLLGVQQLLTCWQIGVIIAIGTTDRTTAIRWWFPGEVALLVVSAGAIIEGWWHALDRFPTTHRWGVCASFAGSAVFTGLCLRWIIPVRVYADWFEQIKSDRVVYNLCVAGMALGAFGVACTFNRRNDPRYVRMHTMLLALLACGHVLLSDFSQWGRTHGLYRELELCCLLGWAINANLLRREVRSLLPHGGIATRPSQSSPAVAVRSLAPVARFAPACHREESQAHAWPPRARAEMR